MKLIKIALIIMVCVMIAGCRKKTTTTVETITTKPSDPVPTTLFKEAQETLKNVTSITYYENLELTYEQNGIDFNKYYSYQTALSTSKGMMKIDGTGNNSNNTIYIVKENGQTVVYPEETVNGKNVKYELNNDFVLGVSNHKVINYLISLVNENDFVITNKANKTYYEGTIRLNSLDHHKNMLDDILYHYVNGPIVEEIYNEAIYVQIVIDRRDQTFEMVRFDLSNIITQLDTVINGTIKNLMYQLDLTNYNEDKIYFPYQNEFILDDAPDTFKNYLYYYSNNVSTLYKELQSGVSNSGRLDYVNDLDIYSFVVPVNSLVNVKVNSDAPFTYFITNDMTDFLSKSNVKTELNYVKVFEPGRYYIGVKSKDVGDYNMNISLNDKFSSLIKFFIEQDFDVVDINNTNIYRNELEFIGEMDLFKLSYDNYEIKNPNLENVSLILVSQYNDHLEYELVTSYPIYVSTIENVNQYLVVYSTNYIGEYNLELIKK